MTTLANPFIPQLTKHPIASLKELIYLSIPLILTLLSSSILTFCDRLFLSHYSLDAWKACSVAGDLAGCFQIFCIQIILIAQVFVATYQGANEKEKIGPLIWQMVWLSIFSMIITYPSSILAESYFYNTEVASLSILYFRVLALANFLYPLSCAFSVFFLGRGKTKIIFIANISIHFLNILLDYFLIYGIKGVLPPMGTLGAAIATITAEGALCIILFILFMDKKYIDQYQTNVKKLNINLIWNALKIGLPRASGRLMVVFIWNAAALIMLIKGGDFLLFRTFAISLFVIFSFINLGMAQAIVTVASHLIGAKANKELDTLIKNSFFFLIGTSCILAIPLLLMPNQLIKLFINTPLHESSYQLLRSACYYVWITCIAQGINQIGTSLITAYKKTLFYLFCVSFLWLTFFLPAYFGIGFFHWRPETFIILDASNSIALGIIFLFWIEQKIKKSFSCPL